MGYRTYLNKINKKDFEKFIRSSKIKLYEKYKEKNEDFEDFYFSLSDFGERVFEFGKEIFNIGEYVFFNDKDVESMFEESNLKTISKKDIIEIIEEYRENTRKYYQNLLDGKDYFGKNLPEEEKQRRIINLLENKIYEHSERTKHYNIEKGNITNSWSYEFNIFELIRIYREFDEENEILFYYGY